MKTSEFFSFIIMHVVTKNHRFLTDICEKSFHGSLILLQNSKKIFFVNIIILIAYQVKTILKMYHRKNFEKTLLKKKTISFLLVFLKKNTYNSFSKSFLNNIPSE